MKMEWLIYGCMRLQMKKERRLLKRVKLPLIAAQYSLTRAKREKNQTDIYFERFILLVYQN
jgi:hypothetical protein